VLIKTKIALAAVLVLSSASLALAQRFEPHGNGWGHGSRYSYTPQYNRRIPGNQGDTSFGQDWAESYGGGK
jgi:hypothetical protein